MFPGSNPQCPPCPSMLKDVLNKMHNPYLQSNICKKISKTLYTSFSSAKKPKLSSRGDCVVCAPRWWMWTACSPTWRLHARCLPLWCSGCRRLRRSPTWRRSSSVITLCRLFYAVLYSQGEKWLHSLMTCICILEVDLDESFC